MRGTHTRGFAFPCQLGTVKGGHLLIHSLHLYWLRFYCVPEWWACDLRHATDNLFQVSQNQGSLSILSPTYPPGACPPFLCPALTPGGGGLDQACRWKMWLIIKKTSKRKRPGKQLEEGSSPRGGGPCPGPLDSSSCPPAALSGKLPQEWVILAKSEKKKPP